MDQEIERDSQPGGRLDAVLRRVRRDIAAAADLDGWLNVRAKQPKAE